MTAIAGDIPSYVAKSGVRDRVNLQATQPIGAAGAVGTLTADDPGITVTKNASAGTYDITFPKAIRGRLYANLISAAGTVVGTYLAAMDASAGTAQLITVNGAGTATNPANGDSILLDFRLDTRSDS